MEISRTFYDPSSNHIHFIFQGYDSREINCSVLAHEVLGGAVEKLCKHAPFHRMLHFLRPTEKEVPPIKL